MTQVAQARLDGDRDNDKALIAETMELIGNSSYGKLITNKEKHHDILYVNESEIGSEIMDEHFYNVTELPDGYYEVEKTKKKINLDLPIHLGVFILNYANYTFITGANGNRTSQEYLILGISRTCSEELNSL